MPCMPASQLTCAPCRLGRHSAHPAQPLPGCCQSICRLGPKTALLHPVRPCVPLNCQPPLQLVCLQGWPPSCPASLCTWRSQRRCSCEVRPRCSWLAAMHRWALQLACSHPAQPSQPLRLTTPPAASGAPLAGGPHVSPVAPVCLPTPVPILPPAPQQAPPTRSTRSSLTALVGPITRAWLWRWAAALGL